MKLSLGSGLGLRIRRSAIRWLYALVLLGFFLLSITLLLFTHFISFWVNMGLGEPRHLASCYFTTRAHRQLAERMPE
jgi:hypothetical protein